MLQYDWIVCASVRGVYAYRYIIPYSCSHDVDVHRCTNNTPLYTTGRTLELGRVSEVNWSGVEVGANPTCAINRVKQSGSLYVGATLEHRAKIGAYRRKMGEQVALAAGTVPSRVRTTSVVCVISIGNEFVVVKCVCVCVCVCVTVVRGGFHKHATTCCKCMSLSSIP